MRNMIIVLVASIGLWCLWVADCPAQDVVHTKDSCMFKGRIVEEIPNVRLVIRDIAGNRHIISWEKIDRIERGERNGKKSAMFSWENIDGVERGKRHGEKSATLSWALSFFLLPSLGQFYNGDYAKGIAMLLAFAGGFALILEVENTPWFGELVIFGDWIWSFIDAPLRSASINRQRDYAAVDMTPSPGRYYAISWQENEVRQPSVRLTLLQIRF